MLGQYWWKYDTYHSGNNSPRQEWSWHCRSSQWTIQQLSWWGMDRRGQSQRVGAQSVSNPASCQLHCEALLSSMQFFSSVAVQSSHLLYWAADDEVHCKGFPTFNWRAAPLTFFLFGMKIWMGVGLFTLPIKEHERKFQKVREIEVFSVLGCPGLS